MNWYKKAQNEGFDDFDTQIQPEEIYNDAPSERDQQELDGYAGDLRWITVSNDKPNTVSVAFLDKNGFDVNMDIDLEHIKLPVPITELPNLKSGKLYEDGHGNFDLRTVAETAPLETPETPF